VKCSHLNLRRIPGYPFLQLQTSEQKNISSESGANYPQNIRMELINNYAIRAEMKLKFNFLSQKWKLKWNTYFWLGIQSMMFWMSHQYEKISERITLLIPTYTTKGNTKWFQNEIILCTLQKCKCKWNSYIWLGVQPMFVAIINS
jgi:hypothetical protein